MYITTRRPRPPGVRSDYLSCGNSADVNTLSARDLSLDRVRCEMAGKRGFCPGFLAYGGLILNLCF